MLAKRGKKGPCNSLARGGGGGLLVGSILHVQLNLNCGRVRGGEGGFRV